VLKYDLVKEIGIKRIAEALIGLPFSAVVVRIPEEIPFEVKTLEATRNFRKAKVIDRRVEIPTGASVTVEVPGEKIEIKDWRGRPGRTPGASVKAGDVTVDLDSKNSQITTPKGVKIEYRRE